MLVGPLLMPRTSEGTENALRSAPVPGRVGVDRSSCGDEHDRAAPAATASPGPSRACCRRARGGVDRRSAHRCRPAPRRTRHDDVVAGREAEVTVLSSSAGSRSVPCWPWRSCVSRWRSRAGRGPAAIAALVVIVGREPHHPDAQAGRCSSGRCSTSSRPTACRAVTPPSSPVPSALSCSWRRGPCACWSSRPAPSP